GLLLTLASDDIRERALHTPEIERTRAEQQDRNNDRQTDQRPRWWRVQERPSEPLHHAYHRVQAVQRVPWFGQQATWVRDGRREQPELGQEREGVTDVSVLDIKCR